MCLFSANAPRTTPVPERQPGLSPYGSGQGMSASITDQLKKRLGFSSTILTPQKMMPGQTTGKTLLGN